MPTENTRSGFGFSSFAPERNPWVTEDDIQKAILFRGVIISSFGQIETGLGELALRILDDSRYAEPGKSPPYGAVKTARLLRRVFQSPGPLAKHYRIATLFLDRFDDLHELRTLMAHGAMTIVPNWGTTFEYINRAKNGVIEMRSQRFTLDQLSEIARRVSRLSRLAQRLYWRADLHNAVPASRWTHE